MPSVRPFKVIVEFVLSPTGTTKFKVVVAVESSESVTVTTRVLLPSLTAVPSTVPFKVTTVVAVTSVAVATTATEVV